MGEDDGEQLPLDVYTAIVETLSCPEDRESLKALALTCHYLRPLCQRLLFRQVTIILGGMLFRGRKTNRRMITFMELASDSSVPLASFIIDIQFFFQIYSRPVMEEIEAAPRFMSSLNNIKILRLSSQPEYRLGNIHFIRIDWQSIEQSVTTAFADVAIQPSLQSLHLQGFRKFPTHVLSSIKKSESLKEFLIGFMRFDEDTPQNEVLTDQNSELSYSQILKHCTMKFGQPIPSTRDTLTQNPVLDLTQLVYILVDCLEQSDFEELQAIIRSAHNIDTLHCRMYGRHLTWSGLTNSIMSLTLRVLKVTISPYTLDGDGDGNSFEGDPFNGFIGVLKTISASSDRLEVIHIDLCNLRLRHLDGDFMREEMENQCTSLDSLFPGAFPRLQELQISGDVIIFDCETEEVDEIEWDFKEKIEEIQERSFSNISAIPTIDFAWCFIVECEDVNHEFED